MRVYDMTVAWATHLGALVVIGAGWVVGLVATAIGVAEGPPWWFFVIGFAAFGFLITMMVTALAKRVEVSGDDVTAVTALGARRTRVSRLERPGFFTGTWVQASWIKTVRYPGGRFLIPGYSEAGSQLLRDLR